MSLDLQYGKDSVIHQSILGRAVDETRCRNDREKIYKITKKYNIIDDRNEPKRPKHSIRETTTENMLMTNPIIRLTDCNDSSSERNPFEDTMLKSLTVTTSIYGLERAATNHLRSFKPQSKKESEPQAKFKGCVIDRRRMKKSSSLNDIPHNLKYYHIEHSHEIASYGTIFSGNCVNDLDKFRISSKRQKL